jgi:hypothetical protein
MKNLTKTLLAVAGISTIAVTTASAQSTNPPNYYLNAVWTLPENGQGLFNAVIPGSDSGGGIYSQNIVGYTIGSLKLDPASGIVGLYYSFGTTTLPGDVVLLEPQAPTGTISDLLRFDGTGGVYFFSDEDGPPIDLADVPVIPQTINPVVINEVGPEGNNGAFYTPAPGQPGFDTSGVLPGVAYNIISDVPEPASATLLLAGTGLWLLNVTRRRRL